MLFRTLLFIVPLFVLADGYLDRGNFNGYYDGYLVIKEKGIKIEVKYPKHVKAGNYFTIKASMKNNRGYARMGGLTLSFPQMDTISGDSLYNTFDKIKSYPPHSKLYNRYLRRAKRSYYYMIEGWERKWYAYSKKEMKIELKAPYEVRDFRINVRGVLHFGSKYNRYEITVPDYGVEDQQGYSVKNFSINVLN